MAGQAYITVITVTLYEPNALNAHRIVLIILMMGQYIFLIWGLLLISIPIKAFICHHLTPDHSLAGARIDFDSNVVGSLPVRKHFTKNKFELNNYYYHVISQSQPLSNFFKRINLYLYMICHPKIEEIHIIC